MLILGFDPKSLYIYIYVIYKGIEFYTFMSELILNISGMLGPLLNYISIRYISFTIQIHLDS